MVLDAASGAGAAPSAGAAAGAAPVAGAATAGVEVLPAVVLDPPPPAILLRAPAATTITRTMNHQRFHSGFFAFAGAIGAGGAAGTDMGAPFCASEEWGCLGHRRDGRVRGRRRKWVARMTLRPSGPG